MRLRFSNLFLLVFCPLSLWAQNPINESRPYDTDPYRKVGQMFTVTIRPQARQIQLQIVGKEIARADFKVSALITVGKRKWHLTPTKSNGQFILESPQDIPEHTKSELKLEIQDSKKSEKFDFQLDLRKP